MPTHVRAAALTMALVLIAMHGVAAKTGPLFLAEARLAEFARASKGAPARSPSVLERIAEITRHSSEGIEKTLTFIKAKFPSSLHFNPRGMLPLKSVVPTAAPGLRGGSPAPAHGASSGAPPKVSAENPASPPPPYCMCIATLRPTLVPRELRHRRAVGASWRSVMRPIAHARRPPTACACTSSRPRSGTHARCTSTTPVTAARPGPSSAAIARSPASRVHVRRHVPVRARAGRRARTCAAASGGSDGVPARMASR